jgi:hypothetical protein
VIGIDPHRITVPGTQNPGCVKKGLGTYGRYAKSAVDHNDVALTAIGRVKPTLPIVTEKRERGGPWKHRAGLPSNLIDNPFAPEFFADEAAGFAKAMCASRFPRLGLTTAPIPHPFPCRRCLVLLPISAVAAVATTANRLAADGDCAAGGCKCWPICALKQAETRSKM